MASAAEPEYVRCAACGDSATTPRAFLLDCCACDMSYHHTCATPPLTEDALLKRATATRQKKATGTIHDWRCHNCLTRQQLEQLERECQDDVIVISSDESDRETTLTPPPPPTPVWKKSVLDLSPANRPAAPRLSNRGASSLRVGLDHVARTRSAAAQRAHAVNSRDPSLPAPDPSHPKLASISVPVLLFNPRHSVTASTSSKMVKTPLCPPPSCTPSQTQPDIDCSKLRKRSRSASCGKERPSKHAKREGQQSSGSLFERIHHVEANNRPPREPSPGPRVVDLTPDSDDEDAPPPPAKPPAASAKRSPVANPTPPASKSAPPPDDHEEISKDARPTHPPHVVKVVPAKRHLSPEQADGHNIGKQMRTDASKVPAQPPARWKDNAVRQDAGPISAGAGPSTSMQTPHIPQSCRPTAHPPPTSQHTRTPTAPAHAYERLVSLPPIACLQSDHEHSGTSTPAPVSQPTPHAFSDYDELDDEGEEAEHEESQDGRAERRRLQEHRRGFQRRRGMDVAKGLPAPGPPLLTPAPPRATSSQPAGPRLAGERRGPASHVPRTSSPSPALSLWGAAATTNNPSPQSPSKDAQWSAAATSNHAAATATSNYTAAASNHAFHRAPAPPTHKKHKVATAAPTPAPAKDTPAQPPEGFAVPRLVGKRGPSPAAAPPLPPPSRPKDADDDAPDEAKAAHEFMYARFNPNYYDGVWPPPHEARLWRRARRTTATRTDALRVVEAWERAQAGSSAQLEPGQEEQEVQQAEEEEREEVRPLADESVVETSVLEEREMSTPRPRPPVSATTSLRRELSTLELGSASSSEVSDAMQVDGGAVIRTSSVAYTKARQRQTARKTVARRSAASGDAGRRRGLSKLAKASVDVDVAEAGPSNASSKESSARATSSGQSKSLRSITISGPAPGLALHLRPLARTTSNASAGTVATPPRRVHLDDVIARLTARRVANPAPPVGSTPVKGRGRARRAALELRLLDGKVLSDAHVDTRRKRREVMLAVKESGSRACESSRLVVQRAPRDALDRAR